jgi:hypothetical protein
VTQGRVPIILRLDPKTLPRLYSVLMGWFASIGTVFVTTLALRDFVGQVQELAVTVVQE